MEIIKDGNQMFKSLKVVDCPDIIVQAANERCTNINRQDQHKLEDCQFDINTILNDTKKKGKK